MLEEDEASADDETGRAEPAPIEKFHRTSVGMVFAAGLLGLRDVLETPKDNTPAIVEDWAGGEPHKDPYVLRLDPDNPQDSIVMVRPQLKPAPVTEVGETTDAGRPADLQPPRDTPRT